MVPSSTKLFTDIIVTFTFYAALYEVLPIVRVNIRNNYMIKKVSVRDKTEITPKVYNGIMIKPLTAILCNSKIYKHSLAKSIYFFVQTLTYNCLN